MFRPLELYIGLRYTRAKRRNHFISFISLISIMGVGLGVAALITVLSVMNGFEQELRQRILGMASHATVSEFGDRLQDWEAVRQMVSQHEQVMAVAPYVSGETMLSAGKQVSGAVVRGILPEEEGRVSDVLAHIQRGDITQLEPGSYAIILGSELAYSLGKIGLHSLIKVKLPGRRQVKTDDGGGIQP